MYLLSNGAANIAWIVGLIILAAVYSGILALIEWDDKRIRKKRKPTAAEEADAKEYTDKLRMQDYYYQRDKERLSNNKNKRH